MPKLPQILFLIAILGLSSNPSLAQKQIAYVVEKVDQGTKSHNLYYIPTLRIVDSSDNQPSAEQTADFLTNIVTNARGVIDDSYVSVAGCKFKHDGTVNIVFVSIPNHRIYNTSFKMTDVNTNRGRIHCHTGSCLHTEVTYPSDGHVITKDYIEFKIWPLNLDDQLRLVKALDHFSELFPASEGLFE